MENFDPLEISSKDLLTIDVDAPVSKAHALMREKKVRHLVVVSDTKAMGILSDRDLMKALRLEISNFYSMKVRDESYNPAHKVRDVMSWPIQTLDEATPLLDVVEKMLNQKISSILLTREKAVVGILTTDDLLDVLKHHLKDDKTTFWGEDIVNNLYSTPIRTVMEVLSNTGI
jgi:CBS domain-containing protein